MNNRQLTKTARNLARLTRLRALHTALLAIPIESMPQPAPHAHLVVNRSKVQYGRIDGKLTRVVRAQHGLSQRWLQQNPERQAAVMQILDDPETTNG